MSWNNLKRSLYRNEKVSHAGYSFASKLEAATFDILKLMEKADEVKLLQTQVNIHLTLARINYRPDFLILDCLKNVETYVEAKGFETPEWRIKLKLYRFYGKLPLWIFTGSHRNPQLTEVIIPKGEE